MLAPGCMCGSAALISQNMAYTFVLHHGVEMLARDVEDGLVGLLLAGDDREDVNAAELGNRGVDELDARLLGGEVAGSVERRATGLLHEVDDLGRVGRFAGQVRHHDVGALAGVGDSRRPTDPGISTGDHRDAVGQAP